MKKICVSILMMIVFSAALVSVSFAQASCCTPGSACCGNVSGGQQELRSSSASSQTKITTAKKTTPQLNAMPWSASVNQIGSLQKLLPAAPAKATEREASSPFLGTWW